MNCGSFESNTVYMKGAILICCSVKIVVFNIFIPSKNIDCFDSCIKRSLCSAQGMVLEYTQYIFLSAD